MEKVERILPTTPGLAGYLDLKPRTSCARLLVQVHPEIDGSWSLREAHYISAGVRHTIGETFPGADVSIRKDPV